MKAMVKTGLVAAAVLALLPSLAWAVPTAVNQSLTVPPNLAAPGKLINLSYSGASGTLTFTIVSKPAHGTLTRYSSTSNPQYYYYLPNAGYQGPDPFTWNVKDSTGTSNTAIYSITVANTAPKANNQAISIAENAVRYQFYLSYSDPDGQTLKFTLVSAPAHGSLEAYVYENGAYVYKTVTVGVPVTGTYNYRWCYTAQAGYTGTDSFTWKLNDGLADSNVATCSVSVNVNTAPTANNSSVSANCGQQISVYLSKTDPDAGQSYTYTLVSPPAHGTVAMPAPSTGSAYAYYTSANNYVGSDSFRWKCNDGKADSNIATCMITVNGTPPVPQDQTAAAKRGVTTDIPASYTGGGGYAMTFVKVSGPSSSAGTVTVVGDKFCFAPVATFTGTASFTWKITYSSASTPATSTATATCTLQVMEDTGNQDWPQWRHDEHRSGVTLNNLPASLYLQWRRDLPVVANAYPMYVDGEYCRPVQLGKTLFVPVTASDSLNAYDTDTGAEKWRFYASGAVRRPPVAMRLANGKNVAIFGSDDGYVYCLDAADGALVWKFRAAPNHRKAMGFGRLSSVWPVLASPVACDGKVYFVAGFFPSWCLYGYCLDAATGSVVWMNDGRMIESGRNSAVGPLTFSYDHTRIYGTNGALGAWALDAATGELKACSNLGRFSLYVDGNGRDPSGVERTWSQQSSPRTSEPMTITVGARTFTPVAVSALGVVGTVSSMLSGDGKLFVTTTGGSIYCFGGTQVTAKTYSIQTTPLPSVSDGWTALAGSMLSRDDLKHGLALVWGVGGGRLVEELAKQGGSGLMVVAVDPDPAKLKALRVKMDAAGWSGVRVSTIEGNPMDIGFAPYQAVIIASEDASVAGIGSGSAMLRKMHRALRPFGGEAWIPTTDAQHSSMASWLTSLGLPLCTVVRKTGYSGAGAGTFTQVVRTGLPDSEQIPKPPYGLVAFSQKGSPFNFTQGGVMQKGVKNGRDVYSWLPFAGSMPGYEPPAPAVNNAIVQSLPGLPETAINPLYSRMETNQKPRDLAICCTDGFSQYGSLGMYPGKGPVSFYDASRYTGLLRLSDGAGCWYPPPYVYAGNGVAMFAGLSLHGLASLDNVQGGMVPMEDEENTMQFQYVRSMNRIEEIPVKRIGVNFGGAVDQYLIDEGLVWTHHPVVFREDETQPLIPVIYRGAVERRYHHSAQMEPFGNSPKGWVYASNVAGMDGMAIPLIQPVVARSASAAPALDGNLSDGCWDGANRLNIAVDYKGIDSQRNGGPSLPKADDHGYAMLRYDNANLYVAAGIHVTFPPQQAGRKYMKIALADRENPDKVIVLTCDAVSGKSSTGLDAGLWTGLTRVDGSDPFTAELAIPWSAIESAGIWKDQMMVNMEICNWSLLGEVRAVQNVTVASYLTPLYLDAPRGSPAVTKPHTVRLYFAEMEGKTAGQRVFDVRLQGQTVLSNLDVAAQAGGGRRGLLKEFTNVMIADKLDIDFTRRAGVPMLSGVEIVGAYAAPANALPVARIVASPASGAAPLAVSLSARTSYDTDGQITTCLWNFGDGASAAGSLTSHVYSEPGTYVARLTVVDDRGGTGSASFTVTVGSGSAAAFVCKIRSSGGDYTTLTAWEAAIQSDLTVSGSLLFPVSSRGSYAAADDGAVVKFTGGGTGTLKHINTVNVAYVTGCTGTIQAGTVTCASGHTFVLSGTGSRINLAVAEGYNDWPATGLADKLTLSGWTTDKDHGVAIRPAAGQGHAGVLKDASGQYAGFAVNGGTNIAAVLTDGIGNVRVEGLIFTAGKVMLGTGSSANRLISCNGTVSVGIGGVVSNCMGIGSGFGVQGQMTTFNSTFINCTSVNYSWTAFSPGGFNKRVSFVNCLAKPAAGGKGFENNQYPEFNSFSYCASSDGTADDSEVYGVGGNNRANQVFGFVKAAQNDFRLAASDTGAQGWGTAGLGADIERQERTAPYDIGADEASVGGAPVRPAITSPLTASGTVGYPFIYTITASGTAPITFGASGLPAGLSRSGAAISGTPTAAGTSNVTLTATNSAGTDSKTLVITVAAANSAPVISGFSPASPAAVAAGTSQPFSVDAWDSDGDALLHAWKLDGATVGVTGSIMTYSPTAANAGSHSIEVTVSDGRGGSVKQTWSVAVTAPSTLPSITTQPANKTVTVGQTATFTVVAAGTAPLSYQWQKNGANIGGATSASYTTPPTTMADNSAKFKVVVTNTAGSATSNEATLTVNKATPTITWATPAAIAYGTALSGAQFNATASVPGTFVYTPAAGTVLAVGSQALSAAFTPTDTASYNTASKTVTLVVNAAAVAPGITTQPASKTVTVGQTVTFTVAAAGTAPLSYQWQKSGVNISGATSASYTTPAVTLADNGAKFKVVVTNSAGSATSSEATLTVQSGGTPGLVRLLARDQYGTDVAGARVEVSIPYGAVVGTYDAGTQVQLTVGTTYRFAGLALGVLGSYTAVTVTSSTAEVAVGFWKTTIRCRDQFGTEPAGAKMRLNRQWTSTVLGIYNPGGTVTLPRGCVVDAFALDSAGLSGTRSQPKFDTGLNELVGQFWKTTIHCRDQFGTAVAGARVQLNVQWTSTVMAVCNPGDTVTLPRGLVVDAFGLLSGCTGARVQPKFDTGLDELVGSFWKATCVARDAKGNPVPSATIKLVKPYTSTVVGQYASGTVVTLPGGTALWAYQVVGAATGAKLEVTFQSPLAEVAPPAP